MRTMRFFGFVMICAFVLALIPGCSKSGGGSASPTGPSGSNFELSPESYRAATSDNVTFKSFGCSQAIIWTLTNPFVNLQTVGSTAYAANITTGNSAGETRVLARCGSVEKSASLEVLDEYDIQIARVIPDYGAKVYKDGTIVFTLNYVNISGGLAHVTAGLAVDETGYPITGGRGTAVSSRSGETTYTVLPEDVKVSQTNFVILQVYTNRYVYRRSVPGKFFITQ